MGIKEQIAIRLVVLRKRRRLTRKQFAQKSGVKLTVIEQAENGVKHISIKTLNKLLKGLEISLRDFIGKKVFESFITETPWKEYFYINSCMSVYLYCDQPTTCSLCGSRVDLIFEYDVLLRYASLNQCYSKSCGYIFMMEADWEEMKKAIAVIKGKWRIGLPPEDCV